MADWQPILYPPPVLTPWSKECLGEGAAFNFQAFSSASSATWLVNNKAYYYPFRMYWWGTARQLLFFVGGTSSGNIDVGIYDAQKKKVVSAGTTAMSATINTVQELNITDTVLPPGDYLLGVACSTTAGTCFRDNGAPADEFSLPLVPIYEQTTALPLPDPCVPVLCTDTTPPIWLVGIQFSPTF